MGIFHEQVDIVNRAPVAITVRFDGQDMTLPPGPGRLPKVAVPLALNQNPIMGSGSSTDPSVFGCRFLIGIVNDSTFPCEPLTPEEWEDHLDRPMRMDEQELFQERYGDDPKAKLVRHGKGRKSTARNRYEASEGNPVGIAAFDKDR